MTLVSNPFLIPCTNWNLMKIGRATNRFVKMQRSDRSDLPKWSSFKGLPHFREILRSEELFHLISNRNFWNFGQNGKNPIHIELFLFKDNTYLDVWDMLTLLAAKEGRKKIPVNSLWVLMRVQLNSRRLYHRNLLQSCPSFSLLGLLFLHAFGQISSVTTSTQRPVFQNTKSFQVNSLHFEPLVSDLHHF